MKKVTYILLMLCSLSIIGQESFFNDTEGVIQLHEGSSIGFHTDIINDGIFDASGGLTGFYGNQLTFNGNFPFNLFDVEFSLDSQLFLENNINVNGNANFFSGNVVASINDTNNSLNFFNEATSMGASEDFKVVGAAAISNKQNFTFPIGTYGQYKPLTIVSSFPNSFATARYFDEDPSAPISVNQSYNTEVKVSNIATVSSSEFWILNAGTPSQVTLTWNADSNLTDIAETKEDITVVGWQKNTNRWIVIGTTSVTGTLEAGSITTSSFQPDDFAALTFASAEELEEIVTLDNYYFSPNGDGINDTLEFEELEGEPLDKLVIFNRSGQKVFEQENYTNQFVGYANTNNFVINKNVPLPKGVYYYLATLTLNGQQLQYQGFFFLFE